MRQFIAIGGLNEARILENEKALKEWLAQEPSRATIYRFFEIKAEVTPKVQTEVLI